MDLPAEAWVVTALAVGISLCSLVFFRTVELRVCYAARQSESYYRTRCLTPSSFGLPPSQSPDLVVTSPDGVKTRGFVLLQPDAAHRPTLLYCHGNGANVGDYLPRILPFYHQMGMNVVLGSYRGFGFSEGSPSEEGMIKDAQSTLNWTLAHPQLGQTPIVLAGTSLGGSVAVRLAADNPLAIRALILDNTPLSFRKLIPIRSPYLRPLLPFMKEKWDAELQSRTLPASLPVLFLGGEDDEIVPPSHFRELYDTCSGTKQFVLFPLGTHNDNHLQPNYYSTIARFLTTHDILEAGLKVAERDVVETLMQAVQIKEAFAKV